MAIELARIFFIKPIKQMTCSSSRETLLNELDLKIPKRMRVKRSPLHVKNLSQLNRKYNSKTPHA
jgi:hypothetical protein